MTFREIPDWDPSDDIDPDICLPCRRGQPGCRCPRPEEEDEELPPLPGTLDARDATPEPPARLDPASVLRNRRRTETYLATGKFTWPRHNPEGTQHA